MKELYMKRGVIFLLIIIVCCATMFVASACDDASQNGVLDVPGGSIPPETEEDITLNTEKVSLAVGGVCAIEANRECTFASSDPDVVSVENGVLTGVSAGSAVVTACAGTKRAEISVKVGGVMLAVGDSIFTSDFSPMLLDTIASDLGYTLVRDTISGSTIAPASSVGIVDHINSGYYDELIGSVAPDLILIGRGTNDVYWSGVAGNPLKLGDPDSVNSSETYGAIRYSIEYFREKYPEAKIVWTNSITRSDASLDRIREFNDNLNEICTSYGVEVIDLHEATGITTSALGKMTIDGIHPNQTGRETYRIVIEAALRMDDAADLFSEPMSWSKGYREGVAGIEYPLSLEGGEGCRIYSTDENVAVYDEERGKLVFVGKGVAYIVAESATSIAVTTAVCI